MCKGGIEISLIQIIFIARKWYNIKADLGSIKQNSFKNAFRYKHTDLKTCIYIYNLKRLAALLIVATIQFDKYILLPQN